MVRWGFLALVLVSSAAIADDKTRAAVFDLDRASSACRTSSSMVERSYCIDNVAQQAKKAIQFYLRKELASAKQEVERAVEPWQIEAAKKYLANLQAMARAYDLMIKSDCPLVAKLWGGGSGTGHAIQGCELDHYGRQLARLRELAGR